MWPEKFILTLRVEISATGVHFIIMGVLSFLCGIQEVLLLLQSVVLAYCCTAPTAGINHFTFATNSMVVHLEPGKYKSDRLT